MKILDQPIRLQNDGQLWVYFLGCGSAFSKRNFQTNLLIVKGDDHLLVDCGTTCSWALRQADLSITDIRNVLITHSHADHVGGLEEMILLNRYVLRQKPSIVIAPAYEQILWERSLRGGAEWNECHDGAGLTFRDFWNVIEPSPLPDLPRDATEARVGELHLRTFRTRHYPEQARSWKEAMYSTGLVIDERIVYSGDTQFDEAMIDEVRPQGGAEVIFQDAQFFTGGIHASLDELETLPASVRESMYLTHYGDNFENYQERVEESFAGFVARGVIYEF